MRSRDELLKPGASYPKFCLCALMFCLAPVGCHTTDPGDRRSCVSHELVHRTGASLSTCTPPGAISLPAGVSLDEALTEGEAVTIGLWNNAALQELLAELGVARGQLLDAGLLRDPEWVVFFPLGPKQLEFTGYQSIDALWLRPIRVRAANLNLERVADVMVQNGLDLVRDVRRAHADLLLAQDRLELAREAELLRQQIADLAQLRLDAGDVSELEVNTIRIDALQAAATTGRAEQDLQLARERLRTLLGLTLTAEQLAAVASPSSPAPPTGSVDDLTSEALAMRPDLRAAHLAEAQACELLELARSQFMTLDAGYDANARGLRGFESGPAMRFTLPVFNGNRGQIAIAEARFEQAARRSVTIRDQVMLDVRTAWLQFQQAAGNLTILQRDILPALRQAETLARRNYEDGGTTYFLVLQTTGQYLDARGQELDLLAALRRASAELDRSVGHHVRRVQPVSAAAEPGDLDSGTPASHNAVVPAAAATIDSIPDCPRDELSADDSDTSGSCDRTAADSDRVSAGGFRLRPGKAPGKN